MQSVVHRRFVGFAGLLLAFSLHTSSASPLPPSSFLGISPQDEKYYSGAIIACRDGSKSFTRIRLNDGFCDCPDGTDEPGTSACPESKFYCRNIGNVPKLLFSSRVNDRICDCCDGSDEYDGGIICRNKCVENGANDSNIVDVHHSSEKKLNYFSVKEKKIKVDLEDLLQNLKGLRIITVIELASLIEQQNLGMRTVLASEERMPLLVHKSEEHLPALRANFTAEILGITQNFYFHPE